MSFVGIIPITFINNNRMNTKPSYALLKTSATEPVEFGEIYPNCNDGRLVGVINSTITNAGTFDFINITFSAVSLFPSNPEANNFTVIVRIEGSLIVNETITATEHTNYTITKIIDRTIEIGQEVEVNITCPDGAAQALFLGYYNDDPSIKCTIEYSEVSESPFPGGLLLLVLSPPSESNRIWSFPSLLLIPIIFGTILGLMRHYRKITIVE